MGAQLGAFYFLFFYFYFGFNLLFCFVSPAFAPLSTARTRSHRKVVFLCLKSTSLNYLPTLHCIDVFPISVKTESS
ncbi:hypothetical protein FOT60_12110 [Serratia marcescens]|nr:hypothetical protein FOT60_12110 [Serratia marcescens]